MLRNYIIVSPIGHSRTYVIWPSRARPHPAYGSTTAASTALGLTSKHQGYLNLFFLDRTITYYLYNTIVILRDKRKVL